MSKIFITGMGVTSTAGFTLTDFWNTLYNGELTYHEIEEFKNSKNYRFFVGARIPETDYEELVAPDYRKKYGKASNYVIRTTREALSDANLKAADLPSGRTAICLGTTMGEIQVEEQLSELRHEKGLENIEPVLFKKYKTEQITTSLVDELQCSGPVYTIPAACASGNYAMALGKLLIEWDLADIAIVGGVDVFSRVAFSGFQRLLSLSPNVCKPFDKTRKGLIVGEGCGIVILEREDVARDRGAAVKGVVAGASLYTDHYHMTAPHPEGDAAVKVMEAALTNANIEKSKIDYISAHGTATWINDKTELKAIKRIFEDDIPPLSSIKSMLGHAMGAAGALEIIASVQMLAHNVMLPTMNFTEPEDGYELNFVPNKPQNKNLNNILSNSFGFGGQISSVIISKGEL